MAGISRKKPQRDPADPEDGSREEEEEGQEIGHEAVQARREGVEDVSAVELAAGDEIERGDEEADPAGDQDGVGRGLVEGGDGGVPVGENVVQKRMVSGSPPKRTMADRCVGGRGTLSTKPTATATAEAMIAGQRAVDAHVHERVAAGDAGADVDDGAGGAAERGSGKNPGQRGAMRCARQAK